MPDERSHEWPRSAELQALPVVQRSLMNLFIYGVIIQPFCRESRSKSIKESIQARIAVDTPNPSVTVCILGLRSCVTRPCYRTFLFFSFFSSKVRR